MKLAKRFYDYLYYHPLRFSSAFQAISNLLTYTSGERGFDLIFSYLRENKIQGDYLEFGSASGNSVTLAHHFARKNGLSSMRFYCFDSFQGLPKIGKEEGDYSPYKEGQFAALPETFLGNIRRRRVDLERVQIIPGWFNETLTKKTQKELNVGKAAFILVDCDLYTSATLVLKFIEPYLSVGTVILFDDWYGYDEKGGEQRAFREWKEKNKHIKFANFSSRIIHHNTYIVYKIEH